jgi:hypothetical protein
MAGAAGVSAVAQTARQPALVEEAERIASAISGRLASREGGVHESEAGERVTESEAKLDARTDTDKRVVRAAELDAETGAGVSAPPQTQTQPLARERAADGARADDAPSSEASAQTQPSSEGEATTRTQPSDGDASGAGRVRQRAAAVGASVGDSLRPRVEKLRERSVVVLDEAAEDPGLRFVLVAAALFVVALLLFIFSFALR